MYCRKCGAKIEQNIEICSCCGEKIKSNKENLTEQEKNKILKLERILKIGNYILYPIITFIIAKIFIEFVFLSLLVVLAPFLKEFIKNIPFTTYLWVGIILGLTLRMFNYKIKKELNKYKEKYNQFGQYQVKKTSYILATRLFGIFGIQYLIMHNHKKSIIIISMLFCTIALWIIGSHIPEIMILILRITYIIIGIIYAISESDVILAKMKTPDENGIIKIN